MKQKVGNSFTKSFWPIVLAILIFGVLLAVLIFINRPTGDQQSLNEEILNQALENQLSSQSIYRSRIVTDGESSQKQVTVVSFANKSNPVSRDLVEINNQAENKSVQVTTEGIGMQAADYIRYTKLEGTGSKDAASVLGKWAKNVGTDEQPAQFLENAIFGSPLMTGPLSSESRQQIIDEINKNKAITIEKTDTNVKLDGKKVYKYTINLNLKSYIPIYKQYLNEIGLTKAADKLTAPASDSNLPMILYIDPTTKKIIKVESAQDSQQGGGEYYSNTRYILPPAVPVKTDISVSDLQNALSTQ